MPNDETLQDDFKDAIKLWLRRNGLDYTWLAQQCDCKDPTVRNWMSRRAIPRFHRLRILELMKTTPIPGNYPPGAQSTTSTTTMGTTTAGMSIRQQVVTEYTIALTPDMKKKLDEKALAHGKDSNTYLIDIINEALNS